MRQAMGAFLRGLVLAMLVTLPAFATNKDFNTSEHRVALVIGNGAYTGAPLANPPNDAKAMAAKLRGLGFEVLVHTNLDNRAMNRAISAFGDKLKGGGVGLFFYSGHGMQVKGRNFLLPVDAEITSESSVRTEAIDVDAVLDQLPSGDKALNIVILDACRNNPFERRFRSTGGGLAQIDAPAGTLIAYSTAPGKVASDGSGSNGLYTQELLKAIGQPGLDVEKVFKRVRAQVAAASGNDQTPWEASSLTGDFYFAGAPVAKSDVSEPPAVVPLSTIDKDAMFWQSIQGSRDPAAYEVYLKRFPNGDFADLARVKLNELKGTLVAVLPLPTPSEPSLEAIDREMVAGRKASVREAPQAKAKLAATLSEGDGVQVVGKVKGENWYAVSRKGQLVGYVVADTLEEPAAYKARKEKEARDEGEHRRQAGVKNLRPSAVIQPKEATIDKKFDGQRMSIVDLLDSKTSFSGILSLAQGDLKIAVNVVHRRNRTRLFYRADQNKLNIDIVILSDLDKFVILDNRNRTISATTVDNMPLKIGAARVMLTNINKQESLDGEVCDVYDVFSATPPGSGPSFNGSACITRDGILVGFSGKNGIDANQSLDIYVSGIKRGSVDENEFSLPSDYQRLPKSN